MKAKTIDPDCPPDPTPTPTETPPTGEEALQAIKDCLATWPMTERYLAPVILFLAAYEPPPVP